MEKNYLDFLHTGDTIMYPLIIDDLKGRQSVTHQSR
jgi:hypothetical protein